jgi:aldehyde:ferredoxin oxidoreductase
MLDEYYGARGWDLATGIPMLKKLRSMGLDREARELQQAGIELSEG